MGQTLLWVTLALLAVVIALAAWASYRRRARRAQARSRAALNTLLAEADAIEQQHRRGDQNGRETAP